MMTMDPRMSQRRRNVAEDRARLDVRRMIWFVVLLAAVGSVFWLATSPMLSVQDIRVFGATNAQVSDILVEQRVVVGRPLIAIRPGAVAAALQDDPWVRRAGVELVFPAYVEVTVDERVGVAWVRLGTRWGLVADDGVLVRYGSEPTAEASLVQIQADDPGLGAVVDQPEIIGAVSFLMTLPPELSRKTSLRSADGDMWAWVAGRNVRLGRPIEMEAKASALAAIIDWAPPGVIDVIAPNRPAVWAQTPTQANPDDEQEGEAVSLTDG